MFGTRFAAKFETKFRTKFGAKKVANHESRPYATRTDFCRIFAKDMNRLYLLSFLLTGDRSTAEKCFVCGLEDSKNGNRVFKEWAESWARRTIIRNAIRMIEPRPADSSTSSSAVDGSPRHSVEPSAAEPAEIAAVAELPTFERFVFVMSVLERYSDQECSLLLDCTRADVTSARIRALQQIGKSAELYGRLAAINSHQQVLRENSRSTLLKAISPLAVSA
jgi:DNA-directed RNA polymerase specialized sigma24 family protein